MKKVEGIAMQDSAFFDRELTLTLKKQGKLSGMTFAVKDVFAVKGHINSVGNPTWLNTHEPSEKNAPVIERLLENGATLKGMTHTDELMYSLNGENIHYGTPLNPIAHNCIPGGSSSGSASAVASGITTFALGTDTGGSVRVPSSYCGLFGIRPTHNAISVEGIIPLAPSFDTVGWMAKDIEIVEAVGKVLLPISTLFNFQRIYIEETVWSLMQQDDRELLFHAIPKSYPIDKVDLKTWEFTKWPELFKYIQGVEAWRAHGEWIRAEKPEFSPAIGERFEQASTLDPSNYDQAKRQQAEITTILRSILTDNGLLVIPTAASVAPEKKAPAESVEDIRSMTMQLTCIAGLAGLPQITVPIFNKDGMALGLSFIANKNLDLSLLAFVRRYFGGNKTCN